MKDRSSVASSRRIGASSARSRVHDKEANVASPKKHHPLQYPVDDLPDPREDGEKNFKVERTHISILDLQRLDDKIFVPHVKRVTHSAGIKRSYTPLLEKYKQSLMLSPEMSDEEADLVRRLRQDPFSRKVAKPKITNLEQCVAGVDWKISPRAERAKAEDVDVARGTSTLHILKSSHHGIVVVPVGKMAHDISFRPIRVPSAAPSRETPQQPHRSAHHNNQSIATSRSGSPNVHLIPAPPNQNQGPSTSTLSVHQSMRHARGGANFRAGGGIADLVGNSEQHERMRVLASFNELKKRAMLIETVSPTTTLMTPEMFVRIEDDFLRATGGRKSRILLPADFDVEIRLGGNSFTRRRLTFLMSKDGSGGAVSFVQLLQYAFPFVSSAKIDSYMLQYSTSMNPTLGGPLETRADEDVYRAIHSFYLKFDVDGDGVVMMDDIVRKQMKLFESDMLAAGTSSAAAKGEGVSEYELASHHIHAESDGRVTLEAFALFARFQFPPYKVLDSS